MDNDAGLFSTQKAEHFCTCAVCGRRGVAIEVGRQYFGFTIENRLGALNRSSVESSQRGWRGYYSRFVYEPNKLGGGRYTAWRMLCPACRHWRSWLERQGHRAGVREYNRKHEIRHRPRFYGGF